MKRVILSDPRLKATGEDLIEQPQFYKVTRFTDESCDKLAEALSKASQLQQPVFPVVIDSFGGSVYALLHMVDLLTSAEMPVATIIMGKAMSAGAMLAGLGTPGYRYAAADSTIMLHEVSSFSFGKVEEIKSDAGETDRLNKLIFHKLDANCGQDRGHFLKLVHEKSHADWFLTAKEAKKHRLIDHVGVPSLTCKVNVEITLA